MDNESTALIPGIIQKKSDGYTKFKLIQLVEQSANTLGRDVGIVRDGDQFMGNRIESAENIETLSSGWCLNKEKVRVRNERRQRRKLPVFQLVPPSNEVPSRFLENLLALADRLSPEACLLFGNGNEVFFQKLGNLGFATLNTRNCFNLALRLFNTGWRIITKMGFQ